MVAPTRHIVASAGGWARNHLLGLKELGRHDIEQLLRSSAKHLSVVRGSSPPLKTLEGKIVANLFFEDSTRTRCSFTVAARRLGADVLDLTHFGSSVSKGETLVDTATAVEAMGVDALVTRTEPSFAPHRIAERVTAPVINAGDGRNEHPTQALLDLLTVRQHHGDDDLSGLSVGIVGDVAHSRVARSNVLGMTAMGAHVSLIGPPDLVPESFASVTGGNVSVCHDLDDVIESLDVIMMLRVQLERWDGEEGAGVGVIGSDYIERFGLTSERAARLKAGACIMHPGPINRGVEIDSEVADYDGRCLIRRQVTNGIAVRMAVLETLLLR